MLDNCNEKLNPAILIKIQSLRKKRIKLTRWVLILCYASKIFWWLYTGIHMTNCITTMYTESSLITWPFDTQTRLISESKVHFFGNEYCVGERIISHIVLHAWVWKKSIKLIFFVMYNITATGWLKTISFLFRFFWIQNEQDTYLIYNTD